MNEFCTRWKRLRFYDDGVMKDSKSNIFILTELEVIQDRFSKVYENMKLHIKDQLRKISYPKQLKTKDALKKVKPTLT